MSKGNEEYDLSAPCIISAAGVINTFKKLLPPEIASKSSMLPQKTFLYRNLNQVKCLVYTLVRSTIL